MGQDTTLYKIGGVCAVAGAIVVAIALLMHPAEAGTAEGDLQVIASHASYGGIHWAVVVGDFLLMGAALALYRALTAERECGFAFYATAAMVGGKLLGTGATVLIEATSSPVYAQAYQEAADAAAKAAVVQAFAPIHAYSLGVFLVWFTLVWLGLGLYGISMSASKVFASWLGWAALVVAIVGLITLWANIGVIQRIADLVLLLWFLIVGVRLLGLGPATAPAPSAAPA